MAETDKKASRVRMFGRTYDYDKLNVAITCAYDKEFNPVLSLSDLPEDVYKKFALQAVADYAVGEMNAVLNDEKFVGTEDERKAAALAAFDAAVKEAQEGKLDFRTGVGLGGQRSAIGLLGTILFELGKKFVVNAKGEKLEFSDVHGARAAVKALYQDTEPQGEKKITSRMIFNAIGELPEVKAEIEKRRKAKPKAEGKVDMASVLG